MQDKIALMILKQSIGDSDSKIINRINTDYVLQIFCGFYLRPEDRIKDKKLIGQIRCKMAQTFFKQKWGSYIEFQQALRACNGVHLIAW